MARHPRLLLVQSEACFILSTWYIVPVVLVPYRTIHPTRNGTSTVTLYRTVTVQLRKFRAFYRFRTGTCRNHGRSGTISIDGTPTLYRYLYLDFVPVPGSRISCIANRSSLSYYRLPYINIYIYILLI
jgi:hypothetical protein